MRPFCSVFIFRSVRPEPTARLCESEIRHFFALWLLVVKLYCVSTRFLSLRSRPKPLALASSLVNVLFKVVLGRVELPTSTLSV